MDILDLQQFNYTVFRKGEYLIRIGETVDYVFYLLECSVQSVFVSERGMEQIYNYRYNNAAGAKAWLGVGMLYMNNGISFFDIIATSDCRCYKISRDSMIDYLKRTPELLLLLYEELCHDYDKLSINLQLRQGKRTDSLLCQALLDRAVHVNGQIIVDKSVTNQELAKILGIHEVTVSRILRVLKEEKVVTRKGANLYILDKGMMMDYAAGIAELNYRKSN